MERKVKSRITAPVALMIFLLTACSASTGVHGQVTDGDTGDPLAGVSVMLECAETGCDERYPVQVTGEDGRYEFLPRTSGGAYQLTILWESAPECAGMSTDAGPWTNGDFTVHYAGYGELAGLPPGSILAIGRFEFEGRDIPMDLELGCPLR